MNEMDIAFFKWTFRVLLVIFIIFYLVVGLEVIGRHDGWASEFFIKKRPSLQFKFYNGMHCGECDFVEYDNLDKEQQKEAEDLCYFRYGFKKSQIYECQEFLRTR
ncbi:hypothetical protein [Moraxella oblonga]|uniref:hypothetical protein n=1 Tax=Moraxella oblonga TaxID=200413 RepID=UPI0008322481|nr:hypothetical protein [Moraxella oblonga]